MQIVQDHIGFIWFGTTNGLIRYDGYGFTTFRHDSLDATSLSSNIIESLFVDQDSTLWVGCFDGGLNRFDQNTEDFTRYFYDPNDPNSLSGNHVTSIFQDSNGTLWVGAYHVYTTEGGLNRFIPKENRFTRYEHDPDDPNTLSHGQVRVIYEDRRGTLWIGTGSPWEAPPDEGGLNRYNPETETFTRYKHEPDNPNGLSNNWISALFEDSRGNFWIGTWGDGLHTMNRETGTFQHYPYDPEHPNRLSSPHLKEGIIENPVGTGIRFIHEDRSGMLWIGAFYGGLHRYIATTNKLTFYEADINNQEGLGSNSIWSICESDDGTTWLGTWTGLHKVIPLASGYKYYQNDLSNPRSLSRDYITSMFEDHDGGGVDRHSRRRP